MRAVWQLLVCLNMIMQQRRAYATGWALDLQRHSPSVLSGMNLNSRNCTCQQSSVNRQDQCRICWQAVRSLFTYFGYLTPGYAKFN